jgi:hypothetical protein
MRDEIRELQKTMVSQTESFQSLADRVDGLLDK